MQGKLTGIGILLSWKATSVTRKTSPTHAPLAWKYLRINPNYTGKQTIHKKDLLNCTQFSGKTSIKNETKGFSSFSNKAYLCY